MQNQICQCCGMPLSGNNLGTNSNASLNLEYCKFCFSNGNFVIPELTLDGQIKRLVSVYKVRLLRYTRLKIGHLQKQTPNLQALQASNSNFLFQTPDFIDRL